MKSSYFAAVSAAAVAVTAHEARSPVQLELDVANLVHVDLCLGLDVKLPLGLSLNAEGCPKSGPPEGCTNVWHPPHQVNMDSCDNTEAGDWHWVHPCNCTPTAAPHMWTTSTITQTCLSTVISCPPEVTNCPGHTTVRTTVMIPATTTICPVPVTSTTLATMTVTSKAAPPYHTPYQPLPTSQSKPSYGSVTKSVSSMSQPPVSYAPPAQKPPFSYAPPVQQPSVSYAPPAQQPPASYAPPAQLPSVSQAPVASPMYPTNPGMGPGNGVAPTTPMGTVSMPAYPPMGTGPAAGGYNGNNPSNGTVMPPVAAGVSFKEGRLGLTAAVVAVCLAAALH